MMLRKGTRARAISGLRVRRGAAACLLVLGLLYGGRGYAGDGQGAACRFLEASAAAGDWALVGFRVREAMESQPESACTYGLPALHQLMLRRQATAKADLAKRPEVAAALPATFTPTGDASARVAAGCAQLRQALRDGRHAAGSLDWSALRQIHPEARCALPHRDVAGLLGLKPRVPRASAAHRVELAAVASVYGFADGVWLLGATRPSGFGAVALPFALSVAAPIAAWYLTDGDQDGEGARPGTTAGIRIGATAGTAQGLLLAAATGLGGDLGTTGRLTLAHHLIGAAGGGILASQRGTSPGQAAMVGSGAIWGAAAVYLGGFAAGAPVRRNPWAWALAGMDLGLLGALVAARGDPCSRLEVASLDLGIGLGAVTGAFLPGLVVREDISGRARASSTLVGAALGATAAWLLARPD